MLFIINIRITIVGQRGSNERRGRKYSYKIKNSSLTLIINRVEEEDRSDDDVRLKIH